MLITKKLMKFVLFHFCFLLILGLREEIKVAPQLLQVNEEIRDLLSELVNTQKEAVAVMQRSEALQREAVDAIKLLAQTPASILQLAATLQKKT